MRFQRPVPLIAAIIGVAVLGTAGVFGWRYLGEKKAAEPAGPVSQPEQQPEQSADSPTPQSRDRERFASVNALKIALAGYFGDARNYPDTLPQLAPKYLATIPKDPANGAEYPYTRTDHTYSLRFTLESGVGALSSGEHTLSPNGFDVTPEQTPEPPNGGMTVQTIDAPNPPPVEPTPAPTPDAGFPAPVVPTAPRTDTDGDRVPDDDEGQMGSDPAKVDSDGDGLADGEEAYDYKTNPASIDTDDDGFADGEEVIGGFDPLTPGARWPDADGDGLSDKYETAIGTDPQKKDGDGDGLADGDELKNGYEPNGMGPLSNERKQQIAADTQKYGLH